MADTLSITGTVEKISETRGSWSEVLDLACEIDADTGLRQESIAAGASRVIDLAGLTTGDAVLLKSPRALTLTAAFSGGGSMTDVPARTLVLETTGLLSLSVENPNEAAVMFTLAVLRKKVS